MILIYFLRLGSDYNLSNKRACSGSQMDRSLFVSTAPSLSTLPIVHKPNAYYGHP